MDLLPSCVLLGGETRVAASCHPGRFASQRAVAGQPTGRQLAVRDGGQHGTPRLDQVSAVAEPAVPGQGLDVVKDLREPPLCLEQADRAQPKVCR